MELAISNPAAPAAADSRSRLRRPYANLHARGEPAVWALGGALGLGILMIAGLLAFVLWSGANTFAPKPIFVVTEANGTITAGAIEREEEFRPTPDAVANLPADWQQRIRSAGGLAHRKLLRIGNFDFYGDDFKWIADFAVTKIEQPKDMVYIERLEWGPFIGKIKAFNSGGQSREFQGFEDPAFVQAYDTARERWELANEIEEGQVGIVNRDLDETRLALRRSELKFGAGSAEYRAAKDETEVRRQELQGRYNDLVARVQKLRDENAGDTVTLVEIGGQEKTIELSKLVRFYKANDLGAAGALRVYLSRWVEFLTGEPREANTEGGILPAIFGTAAMTLLMVLIVSPFGVITALYLREYAKQGPLVSFVRISVNNLAGVPSIVYGVFGLGFFAYFLGGTIDSVFFAERLPNPTFGTGGLLWSALTLALLTVPVMTVAAEEALAAVPRSMREGSLACGASKWQTIRYIVLPRAMPGIMTGVILSMARGAGEVAPLMLVGVVKLAPQLPIDGFFPFVHLERSFMHLGFHIFDVGFQSRNAEAGKPMVFVTTMLLIVLVFAMNATAIVIRNRLKRKFKGIDI